MRVLLPLTLLFPLLANRWLWRRIRPLRAESGCRRRPRTGSGSQGYVLWSFAAAAIVFALSPTTIMYWQGVTVFHAAVLPLVAVGRRALADPPGGPGGKGVLAWAAVSLLVALAMALGSPQFRCRGRHAMTFPLAHHSPMFEDLGIQRTCPWPLDRPGGWWPDVLPAGAAAIKPPAGLPETAAYFRLAATIRSSKKYL